MRSARLATRSLTILGSPAAVFVVAFVARIRVLWELLPAKMWSGFYQINEPSRIAWAMVSGFGYSSPWINTPLLPTAQQPPAYPFLIAGIFKLAGAYSYPSLWLLVGLNAAISALTATLILRFGRQNFDTASGILAAWVWAC